MTPDTSLQPVAVVLAAGKGTRMRSELPKVLHEVAGRAMLARVVDVARRAGVSRLWVVVGHGAGAIREAFAGEPAIGWVEQLDQRGTGHALAQVEAHERERALLVVLSGDAPLVRPATIEKLVAAARQGWGAIATATVAEPGALGRVMVDPAGRVVAIVEARDASLEQLRNRRVNAGLYALPAPEIFSFLARIEPANAQGELYLTDAVVAAARAGFPVAAVELEDADEALGVNDRVDLARVHRLLLDRKARELALAGVTVLEPARTAIEPEVEVGADTRIEADVALAGRTRVGRRCSIGQGAVIRDSEIGDDARIEAYSVLDGATVGAGARVGPFARLRPSAVLHERARVGNFVEVKNSTLGAGAKANHLAYLGDATVGPGANVGAGVITCNFDGVEKHRTEIGARAFLGSDTMLVAPVSVGDDATTGAGSVITRDVPEGALAVERAQTRTVTGWAKRRIAARAATRRDD